MIIVASGSNSTDESSFEQPAVQQDSIAGGTDQQSTVKLKISRLDALDHLEAVLLLEQSEIVVADDVPGLQERTDHLGRALDAAVSLCGLGDDVDVTVAVAFTPVEVATLVLAHVFAAYTYRSQGVPDTAASYEQRAVQLLGSIAVKVGKALT